VIERSEARARVAEYLSRADPPWADRPPVEILDAHTLERPWGWVFFWRVPGHAVAGNAPFLVTRAGGTLRPLGTAHPTEWYVANFERTGDPFREAAG
jgi:hypothetical protein